MAMNRKLTIPRDKDVVRMTVTGHSYVRLLDENGQEIFRFQSPGRHVTAVVRPGRYTVETDGKLGRLELAALEPRLRAARQFDLRKPPLPNR